MSHLFTSIIPIITNHPINRFFRFRRKGAIMVEFLITLPLFFFLGWITWQILFFSASISTAQNAAIDSAHFLSTQLRGFDGNQLTDLDAASQTRMQQDLLARAHVMTSYNGVFLLFHDQTSAQTPVVIWGDSSGCANAFANNANKRVICAYIATNPTYTDVKQVKVAIKGEYNVLGNFIPGIKGKLFAKGYGFSILDNPNRYQYYTP